MLPGFRILIATFVLSASVLIFGLGAAALLRSAHEEFVGIPSWRAAQQPLMPAMDSGRPTLALVRVDPPVTKVPEAAEIKDSKPPEQTTIASVDNQATEKAVVAEKPVVEEVSKPRVRRAKRTRGVRNAKLIRHWNARTQTSIQPQQLDTTASFNTFGTDQTSASGGSGRNRRSAANSPF